ncbi:MAG: ABC transporter permease [Clostridia bacterium]|nr:ABC transporter permease [Clostridia bacterium]
MKTLGRIVSFLVYFFLYAPLLVMIVFSFNAGKSTSVFSGFSLRWYGELFSGGGMLIECLRNSLLLAVLSAVIATLIGTVAAIGIYRLKKGFVSGAILTVNNIPLMNPDIVTGVSMMLLFVFAAGLFGALNATNFYTLLIAHVTFNIPYVILNVLPKLRQSDPTLYEAALDLGCTPQKAFFKVTMPQITSGILAGLLMAFTLSFDDFVISYYTSGPDFVTLPVYIYSLVKKTVKPNIYALYSIILVAILVLLIVYNAILSRSDTKKEGN